MALPPIQLNSSIAAVSQLAEQQTSNSSIATVAQLMKDALSALKLPEQGLAAFSLYYEEINKTLNTKVLSYTANERDNQLHNEIIATLSATKTHLGLMSGGRAFSKAVNYFILPHTDNPPKEALLNILQDAVNRLQNQTAPNNNPLFRFFSFPTRQKQTAAEIAVLRTLINRINSTSIDEEIKTLLEKAVTGNNKYLSHSSKIAITRALNMVEITSTNPGDVPVSAAAA